MAGNGKAILLPSHYFHSSTLGVSTYLVADATWLQVRAALEQVCKQVYGEDVERATALVFSLLHIDLVACTLALLVHVLPR